MVEFPELDASAFARIQQALHEAKAHFQSKTREIDALAEEAFNDGCLDDLTREQARSLYAEAREEAMLDYFDAMAYEYCAVATGVEPFKLSLETIGKRAHDAFAGDEEALEPRKDLWIAEAWKRTAAGDFPKPASAAVAGDTSGTKPDRRAAVNAYIDDVFKRTGKRITRTDIWKLAHYTSRTEFERWESGWYEKHGKKPNKSAHERFTRMLLEKPHLK